MVNIFLKGHDQNSTEMGYAISKRAINSAVASPTNSFPTGSLKSCSIRALLARVTSGGLATNYDVLIGQKSIGKLLELEGFAALPGPTYPTPGNARDLPFFLIKNLFHCLSLRFSTFFDCHFSVAGEISELSKLINHGNNFQEKRKHICEIIKLIISILSHTNLTNLRKMII
jgi:hypothetical protein